jgi:hypothetical protein
LWPRSGQGEVRPTLLHYVADAQIRGNLAQLSGRLIDSTAKAGRRVLPGGTAGAQAPEARDDGEAPAADVVPAPPGAPPEPAVTARTPESLLAPLVAAVRRLSGWKEQHGPRKHCAGGPAPSDAG